MFVSKTFYIKRVFMKNNKNVHDTREGWLRSATDALRPYFEKLGYILPDNIRFAIAFTSQGKKAKMAGECWHRDASDDGHYEIFIRADLFEPLDVLAVLVHELVHTLLPSDIKHGKEFRDIALRVGLEGKMRQTTATPLLMERLQSIAENIGTLPHAKLNFANPVEASKKQAKKWFKVECPAACGYSFRITEKWARAALPACPINSKHGKLVCDVPDDTANNGNAS
jgi:hypothetical protein